MALGRVYVSSRFFVALHDQGLVDVGDHTTASNGSLDERIKFFVAANGQLQVAWRDSLHLQVLASVACELEHLRSEVLKNGSSVHSRSCTDTTVGTYSALQESVNSSNGELKYYIISRDEAILMVGVHSGPTS